MSEKQPRFRSPPFPYISLERALPKAEQMYAAVRHHSAAIPTAAKAWDLGPKSSATAQSIGALIQYSLLLDEGAGDTRRVKLSPLALKIVMDKRPNSTERDEALKEAALAPRTFSELHATYGPAVDVDDDLLIHALTAERVQAGKAPYSEQSAADVVRIFRDTVCFAKLNGATPEIGVVPKSEDAVAPKIGDLVQWLSGDAWQFDKPKRVRAISEDSAWVFVDGSEVGVPADECEVLEPARIPEANETRHFAPTLPLDTNSPTLAISPVAGKENIKILLDAGRLQVTASVDRQGLKRLQKRLAAFDALLDEEEKEDSSAEAGF